MQKKFTSLYRIWHWIMALSTLGLLTTVMLRKTFLSWHANAAIIQHKLSELGTDISAESAKVVAKAIRAPMWEWHYIFGLFLGVSLLLYIYLRFTQRIEPHCFLFLKASTLQEHLKNGTYVLLVIILFIMAISGALIYFYEFLGFSKDFAHTIKEFHELMLWPLVALIVMHFAGVIRHEFSTKEGIVSKMIHGD